MKIEQNTPGFAPVTITLETIGEAAMIALALGDTNDVQLRGRVQEHYGFEAREGDRTYETFDALDNIVKANKCLLR